MKLSDFLIIYLACGAPFAIYFFLQHRHRIDFEHLYLKSFALVFVWIPYAFGLLYDFITKRSQIKHAKQSPEYKLDELQKQISQLLFDSNSEISLFEFREVFERYIGLTLASLSAPAIPAKPAEEIFRVALRQNVKLGAECLYRRNRQKIIQHQNQAREDFFSLVKEILSKVNDRMQFEASIREFVQTLNDTTAQTNLTEIFNTDAQRNRKFSVRYVESDLWKAPQKPSPADKISARLQTLTTSSKD